MLTHNLITSDGSWELRVFVTDLKVEKRLRCKGDMHIGGLILKLVEELDITADWSDHALWWPMKDTWLKRTRTTLDQAGIQADTLLHFTPMHKNLRVQVPDLRYVEARVDFSIPTFNAVVQLCDDLGIRHAEELSFSRPLVMAHLKQNYPNLDITPLQRELDQIGPIARSDQNLTHSVSTLTRNFSAQPYVSDFIPASNGNAVNSATLPAQHRTHEKPSINYLYPGEIVAGTLSTSPVTPSAEGKATLLRPKSLIEKARLNAGWLDSSLSLYEQRVREYDLLLLRFKYYNFYDLNPKLDAVRINQLYEQAKWSLITEELECTEEEMFLFAGLQLQINILALNPDPNDQYTEVNDDIDAALDELQLTLEGANTVAQFKASNGNANYGIYSDVPELSGYLRFAKHKLFTLKNFKRYYFVLKDTLLKLYKTVEDRNSSPAFIINLKGCDITPDLNVTQNKYGFKIHNYNDDNGTTEYWLRCESEKQYAEWITACRLATKGRTMADASYRTEVQTTRDFLQKQQYSGSAVMPTQSNKIAVNPDDYIAMKFLRRRDPQVVNRIYEMHKNFKSLPSMQCKLNYIRAWQALPKFGLSYFVVHFLNTKREEILGIAPNRLLRIDMHTGDTIRTWPYARMKSWHVNWEIKKLIVEFDDEVLEFECLSADCKVPHEFIGGYIFLSMRSKEQNQALNENLFFKLTSGWI